MEHLYLEADNGYRDQILDLVPSRPGLRLLDVGCDDGAWTSRLAVRAGARRRRRSPASSCLVAGPLDPDQLHRLPDERWPFEDETFDLVHANQVIEHVHRLDHSVSETRRVLVTGGLAIICTENLASWHNLFALAIGWMPFSLSNISAHGNVGNPFALHVGETPVHGDSWQHTRVLTLDGLCSIFRLNGLPVESVFASGCYPAFGRLGRFLSQQNARHSHFIGVAARRT